jgi:streptogramin lyase
VTLDRRMRQAGESVRRHAEHEVDPVAMLWRLRAHQRRRSRQAAVVALVGLAGLVAAAVLVARAPDQPEVLAPPPRPLGRVVATIALPGATSPKVVGVADGVVWVDGGNATAYRVDPRTNRVAGTLRLPPGSRLAAVAAGSLWLADEAAGTVSQADPRSGRPLRTVAVGPMQEVPPNGEGFRVAVDGDAVWVAKLHTEVVRVDWARGEVTGRFTSPPGVAYYDLIAAGGGVAVTHGEEQDASLLDPRTGRATAIPLGGVLAGAAFGAGSFWVSAQDYTLARIDPASRRVAATVRLDRQHLPRSVAVDDGAVWVLAGGGLLQRIDPAANRVVHTLQVGPEGVDSGRLAAGAGAVWLSDAQARSLIRIDPQT